MSGLFTIPLAPRHEIAVLRKAERIDNLDALRGIAALMVVFSHIAAISYNPVLGEKASEATLLERFFWSFGAPAVDLFIVLSGYVVAKAWMRYTSDQVGIWRFVQARLIRLLPVYFFSLALAIACAIFVRWAAPGTISLSATLDLFRSPISISTIITNIVPVAMNQGAAILNAPWWTLHIELWGVLLTPWLVRAGQTNPASPAVIIGLLIIVLELLVAPLISGNQSFNALIGIGLGVALASIEPAHLARITPYRSVIFISGIALAIANVVFVSGIGTRLIGAVASLAIVAALINAPQVKSVVTRKLGEISYPLYLIHYPIIMTAAAVAMQTFSSNIEIAQIIALLLVVPLVLVSAQIATSIDARAIKQSRNFARRNTEDPEGEEK